MANKYHRPVGVHRTEIEIFKSRFITTITRATTVDKAREFIRRIREEMPDASHHVYAFRVGHGNSVIEGMSDDGEPAGTSGPPSLAVVRGTDIGDIVVVTTRYFGGTKLGTGGLVRAYTESVQTAISDMPKEFKAAKCQFGVEIAYTHYEQVKLLLERYDAKLDDETFAVEVTIIATILEDRYEEFREDLQELTAGSVSPILLQQIDVD